MPVKSKTPLFLLTGLLCAASCLSAAHAADNRGADRKADDRPDEYHWGLGIGFGIKKSPYRGVKNDITVLPLLSYENHYIRFFGDTLDVKLPSAGPFDFSLRSKVSAFRSTYKASDSSYLAGMDDRKDGFMVGGAATWRTFLGKASLEYLRDISGHSKGSQLKFDFEHSFHYGERFELAPHFGIAREDSKYVNYYFGVKATQATASRREYFGKSSTVTSFGVRFGYAINARQRLLLDISDERWGSGITNSPIVGRSSTPTLRMGYLYRF